MSDRDQTESVITIHRNAQLLQALSAAGLTAIANILQQARREEGNALHSGCHTLILGYAAAAAGGAAVPVSFVDFATIATTNGLMLRALAGRYAVDWNTANLAQFFSRLRKFATPISRGTICGTSLRRHTSIYGSLNVRFREFPHPVSAIGLGALTWWGIRYGLRELLKLVPLAGSVAGAALNGAAAFSLTAGIGEAACVWLDHLRCGEAAPDEEIRRACLAWRARAWKRLADATFPAEVAGLERRPGG